MPGPRAPAAGERYRDVRQGWLRVRLEGGCQGCSLAEVTLRQGIEPLLRARVPEMVGLIDVTDHEAGTPPSSHQRSDERRRTVPPPGRHAVSATDVAGARVLLLVPRRHTAPTRPRTPQRRSVLPAANST
jgi:hypothetical protein